MTNAPQQNYSETKSVAAFAAMLLVVVAITFAIMHGGAALITVLLGVSTHPAMLIACGIIALLIILTVIEILLLLVGVTVMRLMAPDKRQRAATTMRDHRWLFPFWPLGKLYTTLG